MQYKYEEITPKFTTYQAGNNLALILEDTNGWTHSVLTVNLVDETLSNDNCAFIDVNNCGEEIISWLDTNDFGQETGRFGFSGYCVYPEYEFKQEVINRYRMNSKELEFLEKEVFNV